MKLEGFDELTEKQKVDFSRYGKPTYTILNPEKQEWG
jgi:hypothetical protein